MSKGVVVIIIQWTELETYAMFATILAALATVGFNFALWRASEKSAKAADRSAVASEESIRFNTQQIGKEDHARTIMSGIYQDRLRNDAEYIQATVFGQYNKLDIHTLKNARTLKLPSPYEFAQFFSKDQMLVLNKIWNLFDKYYSSLWFDGKTGEFSTYQYDLNKELVRNESFRLGNEINELIKTI